jgi:predicted nucleotidyltransferase
MDEIRKVAERLWLHLRKQYGSKALHVILYGSHARGSGTPESDVDVLVVVDDASDPWEVRGSLDGVLLDILLEKGCLVSALVVPKSFYEEYKSPFMIQVRREGVPL